MTQISNRELPHATDNKLREHILSMPVSEFTDKEFWDTLLQYIGQQTGAVLNNSGAIRGHLRGCLYQACKSIDPDHPNDPTMGTLFAATSSVFVSGNATRHVFEKLLEYFNFVPESGLSEETQKAIALMAAEMKEA